MEELKSTAGLDREIYDDAGRAARRILKQAAATVEATRLKWTGRLESEIAGERKRFEEKLAAYKIETAARLALDRRRVEAEFIDRKLCAAMKAFFAGLERGRLVGVLRDIFASRARAAFNNDFSEFDTTPPVIRFHGLSRAELGSMLEAAFGKRDFSRWEKQELPAEEGGDTPDCRAVLDARFVRISASAQAEASALLLDRRGELYEALLGGGDGRSG
ncbi:MAG: hypothetical protein LBC77_08070 [Spirochaetaceae bacterium]|jgi:hypothetical protein|nr:hypothetical protein [Spirochaetaceae bacterium]